MPAIAPVQMTRRAVSEAMSNLMHSRSGFAVYLVGMGRMCAHKALENSGGSLKATELPNFDAKLAGVYSAAGSLAAIEALIFNSTKDRASSCIDI